MATLTEVILSDDIDGSTDDVITCAFGLGPNQYEIDLCADNREELENILAKFVDSARQVSGAKPARRKQAETPARSSREHTVAIRAWAKQQGLQVSERGRISTAVQQAFDEAH